MRSKMMQICFSVFFCVISGNLLSDVSASEDANAVVPSALISLNDLPEDALIARVLDQKIYLKDINPSQAQVEKYANDKTPEQLEQWQRQHRTSNLSNYFRPLFERYAQQKHINVTEADIEQFNQSMLRNISRQVDSLQKKANSIQKELQAENLDDKKRTEMTERLDLYTNYAKRLDNSQKTFKKLSDPAGTMIMQWKICNRLYEQYGGRVIFQQAGPEPLDAYRKFFEDEQSKGSFEFYNKEAEDLFWEYYRNEKMHTFYSDAAEAKAVMETPWWLREPEESLYEHDADLWGEAADGLCMKIRTKKLVFNTEETVAVIVDLLNIGEKIFNCSSWQQFFEIEVDGQWYQWSGPEAADILSWVLGSKIVSYEFAYIMLTEQWESKETAMPLKLDVGQHSLRFRYTPMYVQDKNDNPEEAARARLYKNHKPAEATLAVTSNLVKFKIIPFEQPLSIMLEGEREIVSEIMQWLARNPKIVRPALGQKYKVKSISSKKRINQKITMSQPDPEIDFKVGIIDPSGTKQPPEIWELDRKLAELIQKHMPEQFQKP